MNENEQKTKEAEKTKVLKFEEIRIRMPSLEELEAIVKETTKKQKTNIGL